MAAGPAENAYRDDRDLPRRLRVVTLIDRITHLGGAERIAVEIATRLDPERFDSTLCASRWDERERTEPTPAGVLSELETVGGHFLGLERTSVANLRAWWPLLRLLRSQRIDVIHAHKFGSNVWASVLGRVAGVPVIVSHEHVWSFEGQPLRRMVDRELIARWSDAFLAVSEDTRRKMIEIEGIPMEKAIYVANGIDDVPAGDRSKLRDELGLSDAQPLVGSIGLLRRQKAHDVLIRAAAELAPKVDGLRVVIAGDGEEQEELESLIRRLGLGDVVTLLGHRTDISDLLAAFDVAVSSSDFEGSPLAVMEYMDSATPIAATAVGGVPELIEDGVNGRVVPPQDAVSLADAIASLLENPERSAQMGQAAKERRRAHHTMDGSVRELEKLYVGLRLSKSPNARARGIDRSWHRPLVLCYHALSETWDSPLAVTPKRFRQQLEILRRKGYRSIRFSEVLEAPRDRVVAITFDDAYRSVAEVALPLLENAGFNATVFAATGHVGKSGPMSWEGIRHWADSHPHELTPVSWDDLRGLRDIGWEVGSHTVTHPHLRGLPDDELRTELTESRATVARELGSCDAIAYPYGEHDTRVVEATGAAGFRVAATLSKRPLAASPLTWPRVGVYRDDDAWRFRLKISSRMRAASRGWYRMHAAPVGE